MGFFSWKTSDTDRPIRNCFTDGRGFKFFMIFPDDTHLECTKRDYEGYGVFHDRDFHVDVARFTLGPELTADVDDETLRDWGIDLHFAWDGDGPTDPHMLLERKDALGEWMRQADRSDADVKRPRFAERLVPWASLKDSPDDPLQGYF